MNYNYFNYIFKASPIVPASINISPAIVFLFIFSSNIKYERIIAINMLNLSMAATAEVIPVCSAL